MLGKREAVLSVANNDVVQDPHIHQGQGLLDPAGNGLVGLARVDVPGGVIVGQDQ